MFSSSKNNIMKIVKILFAILFFQNLSTLDAHALGPVDGEIGVALWAEDLDTDVGFIHGEGWLGDKWGIRGAWFSSGLESEELSDNRVNAEIRWRLLSLSDNNFVALGSGVERVELNNGSDSSGIRVSAEGRFGIPGPIFFYGRLAWVPASQDAGNLTDVSAREFDAGIHVTPFPFMSLRFGYHDYQLDYHDRDLRQTESSNMSGFYLGAGIHW